jgi:DNA-binding transcriptional regulator GbsR (MarR family)
MNFADILGKMKKHTTMPTVEEYAALLKRLGYSIAFGKIFGYLISSDPPDRTFEEIVADLGLSKGSVSTVLKAMEAQGYVEFVIKAGERKRRFRISLNNWKRGLEQRIQDSVSFTELLRRTLAGCDARHREHRRNIARLIAFEELFQSKTREIIRCFHEREREDKGDQPV